MIITPVLIPESVKPPSPSVSDCETLLKYANGVIGEMEKVIDTLHEVSNAPDDGLIAIRQQAEEMLSEAKTMRTKLKSIKTAAKEKSNASKSGGTVYVL